MIRSSQWRLHLSHVTHDTITRAAPTPATRRRASERREDSGLPGGTNRPSVFFDPFPLTFASADGAHLTTVDGKELVDLQGNMTAGLFGHSDVVRRAVVSGAAPDLFQREAS